METPLLNYFEANGYSGMHLNITARKLIKAHEHFKKESAYKSALNAEKKLIKDKKSKLSSSVRAVVSTL